MMKKVLFTLTTLLLSAAGRTQVVFHSVEEAWKYADEHNVSIKIARLESSKSVCTRSQSYSALLPQVSATATYTDNLSLQTTLLPGVILGKPVDYIPVRFGQQFIYTDGIAAQMDLLNVQSWFNIQIARAGREISKDSLASSRKNMYLQVASQYYSLLLMQEAARLSAQSALIADSVYQSVNNKFETGTVSKANVDVAKINLSRAQQTNITAQYQVQTAKNNLKALLDLTVSDSVIVTGSLKENALPASTATFAQDPTVTLAYHQVQQSMALYKAGNATFLPTVQVVYSSTGQQNTNKFDPFTDKASWYPANYWSLRASWNLFNGGNRYFQARKNRIAIDERKLQLESTEKQVAINDENLKLNYRKTVELLAKAEEVMNLSFDNYSHISNRYASGISPVDDRLNAFADYITYQNQYLNSLSDMLVQLYQIKIRQQTF